MKVCLLSAIFFAARVVCGDDCRDAAARTEVSDNFGPDWVGRFDYIVENLVADVLLEDAEVAVVEEVFLIALQLDAAFAWHIAEFDNAEVRQAGLGADGGEFGIVDHDLVGGKLVFPGLDGRKREVEACFCVLICVSLGKRHASYCMAPYNRDCGNSGSHHTCVWIFLMRRGILLSLIY